MKKETSEFIPCVVMIDVLVVIQIWHVLPPRLWYGGVGRICGTGFLANTGKYASNHIGLPMKNRVNSFLVW